MVGFGLDYACAHIIILAEISSENLLPIRADFVTERDTQLPRDGHASFTRSDQFAVTPTFRRRPRNAGNSGDQTFPFPGTSARARLPKRCLFSEITTLVFEHL